MGRAVQSSSEPGIEEAVQAALGDEIAFWCNGERNEGGGKIRRPALRVPVEACRVAHGPGRARLEGRGTCNERQ